jgi:proteasome lid subunit RPN8/RPN11
MSGKVSKSKSGNPGKSQGRQKGKPKIIISRKLFGELARICLDALPNKAYGLVGGSDKYHPKSLYPCSTNLRCTPEWKAIFDSFGEFHKNPDLGFVIAPSEVKTILEKIAARGESLVGVFHSHRFLRAEPSKADIALSSDPDMLCYIISVSNPPSVGIGIFSIGENSFQSIPIVQY